MSASQSVIRQCRTGFHMVQGSNDPGDVRFRSRAVGVVEIRKDLLSGDGKNILSGCCGTSTMDREATLAARWLHEHHPISTQPVGLEFAHGAGRYRPGRSLFSTRGCWICKDLEGFLIRI